MSSGQLRVQSPPPPPALTVVLALMESFKLFSSGVAGPGETGEATFAVLVIAVPVATPGLTSKVAMKVALSPLARLAMVHVLVPGPPDIGVSQEKAGPET